MPNQLLYDEKELLDHGLRNALYDRQVANLNRLTAPVSDYYGRVRNRLHDFMSNPAQALYDAAERSLGMNLDITQEEFGAAMQRARAGQGPEYNPLTGAFGDEVMSWIPGPMGAAGIIRDIPTPPWNREKAIMPIGIDPTKDEIRRLLKESSGDDLRVLQAADGTTYIWPASDALHQDIGARYKLRPATTERGLIPNPAHGY